MRFTIRDLFWLMTLAACALMTVLIFERYSIDHNAAHNAIRHSQHREDELRRAIQAEGYEANWNEDKKLYELTKRR